MRELWRGQASAADGLDLPAILAKAGEALDALAAELGLGSFEASRATSALMARQADVRRLGAIPAGQALVVVGGLTAFEDTSLRASFVLRGASSDVPSAFISIVADHVECRFARVFPWTSRTVKAAETCRIAPPDASAAKPAWSADAPPPSRADALKLAATARGVFQATEADAFGRVRIASLLARAQDGGSWSAARLTVHAPPGAGDRYGVGAIRAKAGREERLMFDPGRGAAWASLELISE